jgi:hypothetical protein
LSRQMPFASSDLRTSNEIWRVSSNPFRLNGSAL